MDRRAIQTACRLCRERHLKCDRSAPVCKNCERTGRTCRPAPPFQFKEVDYGGQATTTRRKRNQTGAKRKLERHQKNRRDQEEEAPQQHERREQLDHGADAHLPTGHLSFGASPTGLGGFDEPYHVGTRNEHAAGSTADLDHGPVLTSPPDDSDNTSETPQALAPDDSHFEYNGETTLSDGAASWSSTIAQQPHSGPAHRHEVHAGQPAGEPVGSTGSPGLPPSYFSSPESDVRDPFVAASDALFQHPPAIFGLPLTATIYTDAGTHSFAGPSFAADTPAPVVEAAVATPESPVTNTVYATNVSESGGPLLADEYNLSRSHHPHVADPQDHDRDRDRDGEQQPDGPQPAATTLLDTHHSTQYLPAYDASAASAASTQFNAHGAARGRSHGPIHGHGHSLVHAAVPAALVQTREAHLVKFFTQTWGPLLDCNDPERHFALWVPQLALTKAPFLLSAIMTISALQLSRVSDYPLSAARYYRRQCGRALIPVLQDLTNHETEGAIFTTYVLLRVYDQMTVALRERPPDSLFSSSLALSTAPWLAYRDEEGFLKRAAFWVHVREDIHVALFLRCPIQIDYALFQQSIEAVAQVTHGDRLARGHQPGSTGGAAGAGTGSATTATTTGTNGSTAAIPTSLPPRRPQPMVECAWSNQIIAWTCDVINFCFGPRQDEAVGAWAALLAKVERWNLEKPPTFNPFHEQDPRPEENQVFPRIWLSCDWHVMGLLYYHLSLILLKSHRPGQESSYVTTSNGKVRTDAVFAIARPPQTYLHVDVSVTDPSQGEIINHTRILCGIVITNPIAQALIVACHMINVAGVFLESAAEQNEVLQLLHMARTATGWPVAEVEKRLREAWAKTPTTK
ncbi:Zn(2)-C6 fungal-type DNA-binding domain protein [Niveomyces insectorum RCEF 264]|uniref:Zn(2)-C6 fungal-type DNA-binding domain protein n=1 Tax=Niveomyces insectorum RCEF 264 TaxID=1081102 RepID=A0A167RY01_9HYPO|nr:Zn(2)-C6 fungal-type DNA-binding domain protein [Niveomyces insectorum RCEF 264]